MQFFIFFSYFFHAVFRNADYSICRKNREAKTIELTVLDTIQTWRTPVGDFLMPVITALGNGGMIWIALAVILLCLKKHRLSGAVLAAALLIDLLLCNILIKNLVGRVRPCDVNTAVELLIKHPTDTSFPSGHTAASFAAVTALFFAGEKKLWKWSLPAAVLIAFSRLYLYLHYPTDILGGILLGILCGWLGSVLVQQIRRLAAYIRNQRRTQYGTRTD